MAEKLPPLPFVRDRIRSFMGRGILLCDPHRLKEFLKQNPRGRDITDDFLSNEGKNVYSEGIAVPLFDSLSDDYKVTVRSVRTKSKIIGLPQIDSKGWILNTERGELVICSFDSLLFWDPFEKDEDPQRYIRFSIPPGWYRVEILAGKTDDKDEDSIHYEPEIGVEFVLVKKRTRPEFSPAPRDDDFSTRISVSDHQSKPVDQESVAATHVDKCLAKAVLSQLTPVAFETFVSRLFNRNDSDYEPFSKAEDIGEGIFYEPLLNSYGGSLHSVFLLQYLPLSLFNRPRIDNLAGDPTLASRLTSLKKAYNGAAGYFGMVSPELVKATRLRSIGFLVNLAGLSQTDYDEKIFPQYTRLVRKIGLHAPIALVGSYDSFLDFNASTVQKILSEFLTSRTDGFAVQIGPSGPRILNFSSQTSFESGVLESNRCPYEPIIEAGSQLNTQLMLEFESLIKKGGPEKNLEAFLIAHAKEIFGGHYDRIEPQIWLRFPELDIAGKERRMDLFMRNSISKDWDLFEIKKPICLIKNYRAGPAMVAEVTNAITQLKRYSRLLSDRAVKEKLKRAGIKYFEPTLNLVIGRRPQISIELWRYLLATHDRDVRLTTFDDLKAEMQSRLTDHLRFIGQLQEKF